MPISGKNVMELIIRARDNTRGAFTKVGAQMRATTGHTGGLSKGMKAATAAMGQIPGAAGRVVGALGPLGIAGVAIAATAAIGLLGVSAVKSFTAFEDAMANVRKTTGMTKEEIAELGAAIDNMALRIPVAHDNLAEIAAIAGQLGIQGKTSILTFTEDVAKMSTAFDMAAGNVATAMAKLANIYDIPLEQISNMGSAINVLGNTTAASEAQLMDFAMSLGPTGQQLGFTFEQTMALGASMVEMGVNSSDAGTRLNRAFSMIGQNLDELSKFMGVTTAEFTKSFEEMPMETFVQVIQKLSEVEGNLEANTIASKIFGEVGAKSIKAITGNLDGLHTNLENVTTGYKENTSLTEEFAAKTDTLKAKFALVSNAAESFKIKIGAALAPLAGALAEGAVNAISNMSAGFNALQKVVGAIYGVFKAFFGAVKSAVSGALKPLTDMLHRNAEEVNKLNVIIKVFSDILIIVTAGAKKLGTAVGTLLAKAITPFVAKIKEAIKVLTDFYDKLGPIKGLIEGVKDKVGGAIKNISALANSLKEAEEPAEELTKALEELGEVGPEAIKPIIEKTEEAIEKQEEFTVKLGDTTVTFKGMAAEVVKNAEAYADLQKNAETLLNLDWSVFTTLEKELPNIDAGIGNMSSAFVGLAGILERNIGELGAVKDSIREINEIAAPFLEKGFLKGIEAIGKFAGALSDAGSAINTFAGLQDVIIDGCVNFSLHVNDMVTALHLLENQMDDLMPSFANMDSLITNIAAAFVYGGDKVEGFERDFEDTLSSMKDAMDTNEFSWAEFSKIVDTALEEGKIKFWEIGESTELWKETTVKSISDVESAIAQGARASGKFMTELESWDVSGFDYTFSKSATIMRNWASETYGVHLSYEELYKVMKMTPDERKIWLGELMHSEEALTFQMDKQTNALKSQTGELKKITDALQPYLEFMQTLNDLAALSAISTDDLNRGLTAINDTLVHLSAALSTFDLEPVLKSLFGTGVEGEAEGAAKAFTDTMSEHSGKFITLITYIERLSFAITTLTGAFAALEDINKSVLADETALIELFESITEIMENFSNAMDKSGFGEKLAEGIEKMVASASPLVDYFKNNNAAVVAFNNSLSMFKSVLGSVIDTMDSLLEISAMTVPEIDDIADAFDKASDFVDTFNEALLKHIGGREGAWDMEKYYGSVFKSIKGLATTWSLATFEMEESFKTFEDAISTITGLVSDIISLAKAFTDMKDVVTLDAIEMEAALSRIPAVIKAMTEFLGKKTWAEISANIAEFALKWDAINEGISTTTDSFSHFIGIITKIVSACTEMTRIFTDMSEIMVITSDEIAEALEDIPAVMAEVTKYLTTDSFKAIEQGLIDLNAEYEAHAEVLDKVMPSYDSAFDVFAKLAGNVISLSEAFETLKEATIISSIDMDKAMQNIDIFINRFVEALRLNMDDLVVSLILVDAEWEKHAKEMEAAMPNYSTATKDIGTLISSVTSLGDALLFLSETGSISEAKFGKGFAALIESIGNFTKAFIKNVDGLVNALKTLRTVWLANEETLVPLMIDFRTISRNFISIAVSAYNMSEAFNAFSKSSIGLKLGFERLIEFIKTVSEKTKEFYTPESARAIAQYVIDIGLVIDAFANLATQLEAVTSVITEEVDRTVSAVSSRVSSLQLLAADMYNHGANAIISFANGIYNFKWVLEGQLQDIANMIKSYLGVSSPTELGALKDIEKWPKNLVKSFAAGVKSEMGTLNNSFGGMTLAAQGGGGGNHTSITFNVTQHITDRASAIVATNDLERMLNRHEML